MCIIVHEWSDFYGLHKNTEMNQQVPRNISANDLQIWLLKESDQPVLVDVRESQELAISPFPAEVVHLPLSEASVWVKKMPKDLLGKKPVVVICHSGIRV